MFLKFILHFLSDFVHYFQPEENYFVFLIAKVCAGDINNS